MELEHSFTVPVPIERAWDVLLDVERVAPCMPGATLDSVDGDDIRGRIKVKVGPISMIYAGTARFTERDPEAHVVKLEASGKETRGAGTAAASVRSVLADEGDQTKVTVFTSLNVTGRPAQFGRGVLVDVGGKLVGMFAANLANMITEQGDAAAAGTGAAAAPSGSEAASTQPAAAAAADVDIAELQLSARATARLDGVGVHTVRELAAKTEQELLALDGIGPATVQDIRSKLAERGLRLGEPAAAGQPRAAADAAAQPQASGGTASAAGTARDGADGAGRPAAADTGQRAGAKPADDSLNLLKVAGMPVLKRALPILAGLVAASLIALRKRLRGRSRRSR